MAGEVKTDERFEERMRQCAATKFTELNLANLELEMIPAVVFEKTNLRTLNLRNNSIEFIQRDIQHLKNLEILNVANNKVKFLAPELGTLPCLQKLDLRNNKLKELPAELGGLAALRELYLNDNRLEELPEDCFGQMWNLETLEAANNDLVDVPADWTKDNLPNLRVLNLRGNAEGLVLPWALRCVHDQFPIMTDVNYRRDLVKRALAIRKRVQDKLFL